MNTVLFYPVQPYRQDGNFADPTYGIVTHTIDEFTDYYQKFFYQAAVIK